MIPVMSPRRVLIPELLVLPMVVMTVSVAALSEASSSDSPPRSPWSVPDVVANSLGLAPGDGLSPSCPTASHCVEADGLLASSTNGGVTWRNVWIARRSRDHPGVTTS